MDKGRAAIQEIINDAGGSLALGIVERKLNVYEKHLRNAGWINLNDPVKDKWVYFKCPKNKSCLNGCPHYALERSGCNHRRSMTFKESVADNG